MASALSSQIEATASIYVVASSLDIEAARNRSTFVTFHNTLLGKRRLSKQKKAVLEAAAFVLVDVLRLASISSSAKEKLGGPTSRNTML